MVDRFSDGYFWGIIDVKGIVFGSSKCYEKAMKNHIFIYVFYENSVSGHKTN
jgi:hypothetical protein